MVKSGWRLHGPWKGQLGKTHPLKDSSPSLLGRVPSTKTACISKAKARSSLILQTVLLTSGQTVIYGQLISFPANGGSHSHSSAWTSWGPAVGLQDWEYLSETAMCKRIVLYKGCKTPVSRHRAKEGLLVRMGRTYR